MSPLLRGSRALPPLSSSNRPPLPGFGLAGPGRGAGQGRRRKYFTHECMAPEAGAAGLIGLQVNHCVDGTPNGIGMPSVCLVDAMMGHLLVPFSAITMASFTVHGADSMGSP